MKPLIDDGNRPAEAYSKEVEPLAPWVYLRDFERVIDAARERIIELETELEKYESQARKSDSQ